MRSLLAMVSGMVRSPELMDDVFVSNVGGLGGDATTEDCFSLASVNLIKSPITIREL